LYHAPARLSTAVNLRFPSIFTGPGFVGPGGPTYEFNVESTSSLDDG